MMQQNQIYSPEDYGEYAETQGQHGHMTHDARATEVRDIAEQVFGCEVTHVVKDWPTGRIPDPVRETGFPIWIFRICGIERIDLVNLEDYQKKILILQEGAGSHFFKFVNYPEYFPKGKFIEVKIMQY
jgi:hypothetical protein